MPSTSVIAPGSEASGEAHAQLGLQVRVDEAQILRLGLGGRSQTERRRLGADARLGLVTAEGEHRALQLELIEPVEHVRLVAARIAGTMQRHQRAPPSGTGVVAGREVGRAGGSSPLEQHAELDALVARDAGVRGAALRVTVLEVPDDSGLEITLEVPDVVRQVERRGDTPGVIDRVDRAASAVPDRLPARPATSPG